VEELYRATRDDRAQVTVYPITQLGLLQITRKRVRQNILQVVNEQCPVCKGAGVVPSKSTVVGEIEKWLKRFTASKTSLPVATNGVRNGNQVRGKTPIVQKKRIEKPPEREFALVLKVHPHVSQHLNAGAISKLSRLMVRFFVKIRLEEDEHLEHSEFRFFSVRRQRDVTDEY
jgi:hypothetical protein